MRSAIRFLLCCAGLASAAAFAGEVYIVPFSHLDLFWGGTREECLSRGNRIITRAIQLAQSHPEFRFLLEDEVFVANFVNSRRGTPELEALKRLVKEGRIEISPKWAGIYQNLPRGEAQVRNLAYGKRYARQEFGVDPQVAHLGDLPGYTWQYPQILAKARTPYMVMTRMGPPDLSLFRWKAPDGSNILAWHSFKGYSWGVGLGLHRDLDQARPGDVLMVGTDGVTEALSPSGEEFGAERLKRGLVMNFEALLSSGAMDSSRGFLFWASYSLKKF